jgi:hypothetical protein
MLTKTKQAKYPSSMSKPFEASGGLSRALNGELTKTNETGPEMKSSQPAPEIQAAHKLIAQIAVRILIETKQERNEQRNCESDPSSNNG